MDDIARKVASKKYAILFRMNLPAKVDWTVNTDSQGMETGGEYKITFPDGSTIRATYQVQGGVGSWRNPGGPNPRTDKFENNSPLSNERALDILEDIEDLFFEAGGEVPGSAEIDLSKMGINPSELHSFHSPQP
jgi:hypothetical protein